MEQEAPTRVVIRIDLAQTTAEAIERVIESAQRLTAEQLSLDPPVHTKRALEIQGEQLDETRRELQRALANPIALDDAGDPIEP